jgi:hypothetical protein
VIWEILIVVSVAFAIAIASITWANYLRADRELRELEQSVPSADDANRALVEAIAASLTHQPHKWEITTNGLKHVGGTQLVSRGSSIAVIHDGAMSIVPRDLAIRLIAAAQTRNAKVMLKTLAGEG